MSQAQQYLDRVYNNLGIEHLPPKEKYLKLDAINHELDVINASLPKPMNVKTTGTINEKLVQLALEGHMEKSWYKLVDKKYQWLGDFGVQGYPLSAIISVKSFKAKERLLVSGTGTLHAPTIGWGRFNDKKEFSEGRLKAYLFRGFLAIYMPQKTIDLLSESAKSTLNHFHKPLLRCTNNFGTDLEKALFSQNKMAPPLLDTSIF